MLKPTRQNSVEAVAHLTKRHKRLINGSLTLSKQRRNQRLVRLGRLPELHSPLLQQLLVSWDASEVLRGIAAQLHDLLLEEIVLQLLLFAVLLCVAQFGNLTNEITQLIETLIFERRLMFWHLLQDNICKSGAFIDKRLDLRQYIRDLAQLLRYIAEYTTQFFNEFCST